MGSSSERTLSFSGAADAAFAEAQRALAAIGAKATSANMTAGTLTATKGESFVSRGETLTVRIERLDGGCAIHVRSDSPDDIDWGRNTGNVTQFEQALTGSSAVRGTGAQTVDPSALSAPFGG